MTGHLRAARRGAWLQGGGCLPRVMMGYCLESGVVISRLNMMFGNFEPHLARTSRKLALTSRSPCSGSLETSLLGSRWVSRGSEGSSGRVQWVGMFPLHGPLYTPCRAIAVWLFKTVCKCCFRSSLNPLCSRMHERAQSHVPLRFSPWLG